MQLHPSFWLCTPPSMVRWNKIVTANNITLLCRSIIQNPWKSEMPHKLNRHTQLTHIRCGWLFCECFVRQQVHESQMLTRLTCYWCQRSKRSVNPTLSEHLLKRSYTGLCHVSCYWRKRPNTSLNPSLSQHLLKWTGTEYLYLKSLPHRPQQNGLKSEWVGWWCFNSPGV